MDCIHEQFTERWNLTDEKVAVLLGGTDVANYLKLKEKAKAGLPIITSEDVLERISLLLGISKSLTSLAPADHQDLAWLWFNKPNSSMLICN